MSRCCCGKKDIPDDESGIIVNEYKHEVLGPPGNFCGPDYGHQIRNGREEITRLRAEVERLKREVQEARASENALIIDMTMDRAELINERDGARHAAAKAQAEAREQRERAEVALRERDEARAGRVAARAEVELLREARREEHREASAAAAYSARRQTELERDLTTAEARVAALEAGIDRLATSLAEDAERTAGPLPRSYATGDGDAKWSVARSLRALLSPPATDEGRCCAGKAGCPGGRCYVDPGIMGCDVCGGRAFPGRDGREGGDGSQRSTNRRERR